MKPKIIDLGFKFNDQDLYPLDLPVEEVLISEIIHNADIPYLEQEGTDDWNLSPNQLIANWDKNPTHATRVKGADLSYPIMLFYFKDNWIILDGVHRFTKALMEDRKTILAKRVPQSVIETLRP